MTIAIVDRAAWDFIKENRTNFDVVVLNPCLVIGPMLQPSLNTSSEMIVQYLNGSKEKISDSYPSVVDVRDVARAHIKAAENPAARGRYILNPYTEHWSKIVNILRELDVPGLNKAAIPTEVEESGTLTLCFLRSLLQGCLHKRMVAVRRKTGVPQKG
eukprot:gb/GECG01009295.1/.p1 GENE.gb/GECG01009295.1/~~gb/GECG01009295.1/.p1  ORF type:complete len:158 (+),score=17.81 gb/GECG01009295.1/:1-474(+)